MHEQQPPVQFCYNIPWFQIHFHRPKGNRFLIRAVVMFWQLKKDESLQVFSRTVSENFIIPF
jgi:hypothetical protein